MAFTVTDINSRFVSKGPIHKLLNNFAASFDSTDDWKPTDGLQTGRRSRIQPCPGYILCITCPRHLYELSFEPSKTNVEFKVLNFSSDLNLLRLFLYFKACLYLYLWQNWEPILTLIERIILANWKKDEGLGMPHFCQSSDGIPYISRFFNVFLPFLS